MANEKLLPVWLVPVVVQTSVGLLLHFISIPLAALSEKLQVPVVMKLLNNVVEATLPLCDTNVPFVIPADELFALFQIS